MTDAHDPVGSTSSEDEPDYFERSAALSWMPITCTEREALVNERPGGRYQGMSVAAARTDDEVVYTEWYDVATDTPLLRDWRYPSADRLGPDRKPCEHFVPFSSREAS